MEDLSIWIQKWGKRCCGMGRHQNRWWSIPHTIPGETVDGQPHIRDVPGFHARVSTVLIPSPHRTDPGCDTYNDCPGCSLRHVAYSAQCRILETGLKNLADRKGIALPDPVSVRGQTIRNGYRIRALVRSFWGESGCILGMAPLWTGFRPVSLVDCPNHSPNLNRILTVLQNNISSMDEIRRNPQIIQTVSVELSTRDRHRITCVGTGTERLASPGLLRHLTRHLSGCSLHAIEIPQGSHRTRSLFPRLITGDHEITFPVAGSEFRIGSGVWIPVSYGLVEQLGELVVPFLQNIPESQGRLIELGCGAGLMTQFYCEEMAHVLAVDSNPVAVDSARLNIPADRFPGHVEFRHGRADKTLRKISAQSRLFDIAVLHGMRSGYDPQSLSLLKNLGVKRLVFISPNSLVEDMINGVRIGYRPVSVTVVNQIPHTSTIVGVGICDLHID